MTPDISQLLIFNPDLTIEQYLKMLPKPPVELVSITLSSSINNMVGAEDPKTDVRNKFAELRHERALNEALYGKLKINGIIPNTPFLPFWKG